ncbi:UNVERIFIED_CONTAM: hypothetical protein Scaly_0055100 [Sesamum calycinum]|uniref:Uncharacterized protein n=1 Tax=Sesamum calycinum TaxID=2727403 RepID=A0AAW2SV89_9LAMI
MKITVLEGKEGRTKGAQRNCGQVEPSSEVVGQCYRCYDPFSHPSFTSADVTFFDSTPYFFKANPATIPSDSIPLHVISVAPSLFLSSLHRVHYIGDIGGIEDTKAYLQKGKTKYFFGNEMAHRQHGISLVWSPSGSRFVCKQTTIARSSVEAKYMAIAHTTSDILWLKNSLGDLGFENNDPVSIIVIKQKCELLVIRFPWRTKHVQVNCTFFLRQL